MDEKEDHYLNSRHAKCENKTGSGMQTEYLKILWPYHKRSIEPKEADNRRIDRWEKELRKITNELDRSDQVKISGYPLEEPSADRKPRALERNCCQCQLKDYQISVFERRT